MGSLNGCASMAVVLLGLTACGGDDDTSSADGCPSTPEVTVGNAGAEPRRLMELTPTVGDTQALDMEMTMSMDLTRDGEPAPTRPIPTMSIGMVFTVEDVTDDEVETSFVYDDVAADDPAVQSALESLTSVSGSSTTTRSGAFVDAELHTDSLAQEPSQIVDQLEQQMADMVVPLPDEAVGVGAEWEVVRSVEADGIASCFTAVYELVEFDGDEYELAIDVTQEVLPTTIDDAGTEAEVVGGAGSTTGQITGSLSLPIAFSSTSETRSTVNMLVERAGQEINQEVGTDIVITVTPRD